MGSGKPRGVQDQHRRRTTHPDPELQRHQLDQDCQPRSRQRELPARRLGDLSEERMGCRSGGGTPAHPSTVTIILHWNGSSWSQAPSPSPGGTIDNYLFGVSADSGNDAWAIGQRGPGTTKAGWTWNVPPRS